jgi:O-antigen ligase
MSFLAYAAIWLFVFAVPWERLTVIPGLSIATRVMGVVALGLTLLTIVISGRIRRWRPFHVIALIFVIWAGFGLWVLGVPKMPQKYYTFAQLFIVLILIWELASTPARQRGILVAYVLGASVPAVATILLYMQAGDSLRRFSAAGDANSLAMTLVLALPVAWYLSLTTRHPPFRWVYRAYLPLCMLATALTGSRGGMLTLMVALLIIPVTVGLSPGRLAIAIGLLAVSGMVAVTYVPQEVAERLGTTTEEVEQGRFGGRLKLWRAGFNAFTRRPLVGYGVAGFKPAVTPELGPMALVAHNSFLSVLVEEGLIGLLLFLMMLTAVFLSILRLPLLERRFSLVLLAALFVAMNPLTWEDQKVTWMIMAMLMGMSTLRVTAASTGRQLGQQRVRPMRREPVAGQATGRLPPSRPDLGRRP